MDIRPNSDVPERTGKFYQCLSKELIDFAEAEFELGRKENKQTVREHLQQVERSTGKVVEELHPNPLPQQVEHLWQWFQELLVSLISTEGIAPLSFIEIKAWSDMTGNRPSHLDITMLRQLYMLYLKKTETRNEKKS